MSAEWQERFVAMLNELRQEYPEEMDIEYRVESGRWVYFNEECDEQWEALRYSKGQDGEWFDVDGNSAGLYGFIPCFDPIPHYKHNCLPTLAERRAAREEKS